MVSEVVLQAALFFAAYVISWGVYRSTWTSGLVAGGSPLLRFFTSRRFWSMHGPISVTLFVVEWRSLGVLAALAVVFTALLAFASVFRFGDLESRRYHVVDRLVVTALAVAAPFSPGWFYLSLLASCALQYRVAAAPLSPGYSNLLGFELVRRLASTVAACGLCETVAAFAPSLLTASGERAAVYIAVVLSVHAAYYVHQGLAKIGLGRHPLAWVVKNRVSCLLVNAYLRGWGTTWWSEASVLRVAAAVAAVRVPICAAVFFAEVGCVFILLNESCATAWLLGLIVFHIVAFAATGLLTYHHVAINAVTAAIIFYGRAPAAAFSLTSFTVATICCLLAFGWIAVLRTQILRRAREAGRLDGTAWRLSDPADLWMAWWDGPFLRLYTYTVVTSDGSRFAFPVTSFSPYDTFLTDLPTHILILGLHDEFDPQARRDAATARCGVWGLLIDASERDQMYRWMDEDAAHYDALRAKPAAAAWTSSVERRGPAVATLLHEFCQQVNRLKSARWFRIVWRWPHFPGEDLCTDCPPLAESPLPTYRFDRPIARLEIHRRKTFYTGRRIVPLETSLLGTLIFDEQ